MSKRIIKAKNYFTRSASHSMTGSRRGFVNILPPSAVEKVISEDTLTKQRDTMQKELHDLRNIHQKRRVKKGEKNRIDSLNGMIGNINKTLCLQSDSHYDEMKGWVFWRIANHRLVHNIFREIDIEAEKILNKFLTK